MNPEVWIYYHPYLARDYLSFIAANLLLEFRCFQCLFNIADNIIYML